MNKESKRVIDGKEFWVNGVGSLVPLENIEELDVLRDETVREIINFCEPVSSMLVELKKKIVDTLMAYLDTSAEEYGVKTRSSKGAVTLTSFDGSLKVIVSAADILSFDERLQTAKDIIDECLIRWSEGANHNLLAIVNDAFKVDKKGQIDTKKILALPKLKIDDKDWKRAMKAIKDSVTVQTTKKYIRLYKRVGDEWNQIILDWSKIQGGIDSEE